MVSSASALYTPMSSLEPSARLPPAAHLFLLPSGSSQCSLILPFLVVVNSMLLLTDSLCGTEQYGRAASACGRQQHRHAAGPAAALQAVGARHGSSRWALAGLHQACCLRRLCGKPSCTMLPLLYLSICFASACTAHSLCCISS